MSIPSGETLLIDVNAGTLPKLKAVIVEGNLIFEESADPTHHTHFRAEYIMVFNGHLQVGTEADPFGSKITIELFGTEKSPEIPTFGNKCIGVMNGKLDLHGIAKNPTWTELLETADVGATSITLVENVDWAVGDVIVIAPTSFNFEEAERREIKTVSGATIHFEDPLQYKHFAGMIYFSDDVGQSDDNLKRWVRAEVGVLTRNVIIRGDEETSADNLYGAHMMFAHTDGKHTYAKIENIEMVDVGQSFQLRRYPIHFHMLGNVADSYVKGNSIHDSYSRLITVHGVRYLHVKDNVGVNAMGHNIFVEDGKEYNNIIEHNLVLQTRISWSLLTTD